MNNARFPIVPPGIAALFRRYERAVEECDRNAWADCWSEHDAVWTLDFGEGTQHLTGKTEIIAAWVDRMARVRHVKFHHEIDSILLNGHDRAAIGSSTREIIDGIDGTVIHASGRYSDEIAQHGDHWRFVTRNFVLERRVAA